MEDRVSTPHVRSDVAKVNDSQIYQEPSGEGAAIVLYFWRDLLSSHQSCF